MIISCFEISGNIRKPCKKPYMPIPVIFNDMVDMLTFCYVINSATGDPNYIEARVPNNFQLLLSLGVAPDEYATEYIEPAVYISLHNPLKMVNPYLEGTVLRSGHKYQGSISSVVERISLPSPYETDCFDYVSLWKKNNGSGPITIQACIEKCIMEDSLKKKQCVPIYITYPHTEDICPFGYGGIEIPADVENKCSKKCRSPCFDRTYSVDYKEVGYMTCNSSTSHNKASEWCKYTNLTLDISFKNNRIQLIQTLDIPKIEAIELFSIIGGYLGLWIGLSLIDVADFLNCLFLSVRYSFISKKKKNPKGLQKSDLNIQNEDASVFQRCYIACFADVSSSKSTKEKLQKVSIFFFCVCGLIWHSNSLISAYMSYETVRKEVTSKPLKFVTPAVTICDSVTRYRSDVCEQSPQKCSFLENATFCQEFPIYCNIYSRSNGIYKENYICKDDCPSWLDLDKLSRGIGRVPGIRDDNELNIRTLFKRVPFTTNEGEPTICFIYSPKNKTGEFNNISTWLSWILIAASKAFEYLNFMENVTMYLAIHDARRKVNPFREGIKLELTGNRYRIFVNEEVETALLPFPYNTNCTDYLNEWKRNNGSGPLTTLECIDYCVFSHYLKEKNCIPRFLRISHEIQLCNADEVIPQDLMQYCNHQCGIPCLERNYKYEVRKTPYLIPTLQISGKSIFFHARFELPIRISFRNYRHTEILYEPKIIMMDIFSGLGGYLGIWLGVSLLSVLDLLYLFLIFCLRECRSRINQVNVRAPKIETRRF